MQRIILHLDMNSYFASVEQQANPFLRGKPVGICAYLSENGCIIASSVEAKGVGIKTGCRVKEAKRLYPKIILIENDPNKYRTVTKKLFKIMTSYSSEFEPYSIDEGFLDLTGYVKNFDRAAELASAMRQRIKEEIGEWLKCSIGISYTKFLAKFCSDVVAVDKTKVFKNSDDLEDLYRSRQLTDAWGINVCLEKRLNALGIYNLVDLKNYSPQNLLQAFGKIGYFLWAKVNGIEIEHFKNEEGLLSKSIGHSYCLPKKTTDKKYLSVILFKLVEKTAKRLRERNQLAGGVYIYWSYQSRIGYGEARFLQGVRRCFKLKSPVFSTEEIFQKVHPVLENHPLKDRVAMLAVGVFNLGPVVNPAPRVEGQGFTRCGVNQLNLFNQTPDYNLTKAVDKINSRYGNQAIYIGRLWKTEQYAKDRIGFRKIEGVDYQV